MIYFEVINPHGGLVLVDMETQPCTVQAYRDEESGVADDLKPSSRVCVHVCVYMLIFKFIYRYSQKY